MQVRCRVLVSIGLLVLLALLAVNTAPLAAQVDDEIISGVQFNFTPPGARSLGLGGAFVAVANDATAAFSNPAGLVNLSRQEVSVEGRRFQTRTLFSDAGHVLGPPTGLGVDTRSGVVLGETEDETSGLSFLSYVLPVGRLRVAFFRHELVNFQSNLQSSGAFYTLEEVGPCVSFEVGLRGCQRLFPVRSSLDLQIENLGGALAYQLSDRLALGLGVNIYSFEIAAQTRRFDVASPERLAPGGFFGVPLFSAGNVFATQVQRGSDDEVGLNVGLLFDVTGQVSLGVAYRQGLDFDYFYDLACGPSDPAFCRTTPGLEQGQRSVDAAFGVPSVLSAGISVRPVESLTLALDLSRVEYSALVDDFAVAAGPFARRSDFVVDDATEVHLGLEFVFARMVRPLALRLGAWHDPRHQIRYGSDDPAGVSLLWSGSRAADDEIHLSGGVGWTVAENFSLDLGADFSERIDIASLSAVLRF